MPALMLRAGNSYLVSMGGPLLEDYELLAKVELRGRDWSGLTYHPLQKRLYLVSAGERRIRCTDLRGREVRGIDIKTRGFGALRDIVYAGPAERDGSFFYLVEEKSWRLVRVVIGPRTRKIHARDCEQFSLAHAPGGPGEGPARADAGLEGLAWDPRAQQVLFAREGSPRVYAVPARGLPRLSDFELAGEVGPEKAGRPNHRVDVVRVQKRLEELGELTTGYEEGSPDARTIAAIRSFQGRIGYAQRDGVITPGKRTHRGLLGCGWTRPAEAIEELSELSQARGLQDLSGLCALDDNKKVFGGGTLDPVRLMLLSRSAGQVVEVPRGEGLDAEVSRLSLRRGKKLREDLPPAEGLTFDAERRIYLTCRGEPEQLCIFGPPGASLAEAGPEEEPEAAVLEEVAVEVADANEGRVLTVSHDKKLRIDDEGWLQDPEGVLPEVYHFPPPVPDKKIKVKNKTIDWVVVHYTVQHGEHKDPGALRKKGKNNLRSHFLIGRDGKVSQLATVLEKTYHAGSSKPRNDWDTVRDYLKMPWKVSGDCNKRSVGIDFCNWGYLVKHVPAAQQVRFAERQKIRFPDGTESGHRYKKKVWERYTDAQLRSFVLLARALVERFPQLNTRRFMGHDNLNENKNDPGPAFPYAQLLRQIFSGPEAATPPAPAETEAAVAPQPEPAALAAPAGASAALAAGTAIPVPGSMEVAAEGMSEIARKIMRDNPRGYLVSVYVDYDKHNKDNQGIANFGEKLARKRGGVGFSGGVPKIGKPIVIKKLAQISDAVLGIHDYLFGEFKKAGGSGAAPAWTRVRVFSLCVHGMHFGVSLNHKNLYNHGLHLSGENLGAANVQSFFERIKHCLTPDVVVPLFACNVARDVRRLERLRQEFTAQGKSLDEAYDESQSLEWKDMHEGSRGGRGSFAEHVAQVLGPQASVFGHSTPGHSYKNFAARVFGNWAGPGGQGMHVFELLYPPAFIDAECARVFPDATGDERTALRWEMRMVMWKHFKLCFHEKDYFKQRFSWYPGWWTFIEPGACRQEMQADWQKYCADNTARIRKLRLWKKRD